MNNNTGSNSSYSWNNTSQWSQIPTGQQGNAQQSQASQSAGPPQSSPPPPSQSQYSNPQPTEPRRDMIARLYKQILGREPDNTGLNYYLFNTSIPEHQIARDMYESTEHLEMLNKAKDIREMIKKLENEGKKNKDLELRLRNAEELVVNYKKLLDQKTNTINALQQGSAPGTQKEEILTQQTVHDQQDKKPSVQTSEGTFISDPFAEDEKSRLKGCLGSIAKWFRF